MSMDSYLERLQRSYQHLVKRFNDISDSPIEGLEDRLKQAKEKFSGKDPFDLSEEDNTFLDRLAEDIEKESKKVSELEEQKKLDEFCRKIDALEKSCMESPEISEQDKKEISEYMQLKKDDGEWYDYDQFASGFNGAEDKYKLAFLKITQNILFQDRKDKDFDYHDELEKKISGFITQMPEKYRDRYVDILVTAAESNSDVGIYCIATKILEQFGVINADRWISGPVVKEDNRDFYLDVSKRAAVAQPQYDTDVLRNLPDIIEKHGLDEAKKTIDCALQIKDEDFPGEINLILFYTGIKAGHKFAGTDKKREQEAVKMVEERYLK